MIIERFIKGGTDLSSMRSVNYEFGFSKKGINASKLAGVPREGYMFGLLKSSYIGLRQGPVISDLFQVMNPDEILAFSAGWSVAASNHDFSVLKSPEKLYSNLVSYGWKKFPLALKQIQGCDGVNLFSRVSGDLAKRVKEMFDCRLRVREILSSDDRALEFEVGPSKESLVCDMRTKGPSNHKKIAGAIVAILREKHQKAYEKRPLEFLLNDVHAAAFAKKRDDYVDDIMADRIPIMLDNLPDNNSYVKEYQFLHDKVYGSQMKKEINSQKSMFDDFSDPRILGH